MRIDLTKIKDEEEVPLSHQYDPKREDLEFDDCHYMKKLMLEGSARRESDTLMVRGRLTSTCEIVCSRCLAPNTVDINETVDLLFDIKGKKYLDITSDVRDHLIFLHPQKYLCNEGCKGLCPHCGINLNTGHCTCSEKGDTNKFSQLKEWFHDKQKES